MSLENVTACLICDSHESDVIETTSTMMASDSKSWDFKKCSSCDLVYLSPRVPAMQLDEYYTDSYLPYRGASAWGKYSKLVEGDQNKIDTKRLKTIQKFISAKTASILDIGCGKPSFLKRVQEQTDLEAIGLDFSDKGWIGQLELYNNLDLHVGSVEDLSADIKADVITMWHYLEHDYNPRQTLLKLSETQKHNALLIIEVPNHDSYTRKKHGKYWSGYHSPRHTALYTPQTMQRLLDSTGWEVEEIWTYGSLDPYTLDWMSRMERKEIDWTMSMENYFVKYVLGKLVRPKYYFDKSGSLGFMTAIARKRP